MAIEVSDRLIDAIVAYFSDPEDVRGLWSGLCFMEQSDLDLSLRSHEILGYLRDPRSSPVPQAPQLTDEDAEPIIIGLRTRIREELQLPPLSEDEKRTWKFVPRPVQAPRPSQMQPKTYGQNFAGGLDPKVVRDELEQEDPELLRAVELFTRHNATLPRESPNRLSYTWFGSVLDPQILRLHPELGAVDALEIGDYLLTGAEERYRSGGE